MTKPADPTSFEAMAKLAKLMNNSPSVVKLKGTEWEIHSLKPGTQWKIAEVVNNLEMSEASTTSDILKELTKDIPAVCRIITMALVNDKRILDFENDKFVTDTYNTLMWGEYETKDWIVLLYEVINLIEVDFILASTNAIKTFRKMTLERKTTMKEQGRSAAARNGGK